MTAPTANPVSLPIHPPYVPPLPPPPPPPTPPPSFLNLTECALCFVLLGYNGTAHLEWHRMNDLHGRHCAEMQGRLLHEREINAGRDPETNIEPCDCGLVKTEETK